MADLMPSLSSDEEGKLSDSDNDDGEEEIIDESFEFGGILGEDGGLSTKSPSAGWSYETALRKIQMGDSLSQQVPRMDVSALIAAKRSHLETENGKKPKKSDKANRSESSESENESQSGSEGGSDSDSSEEEDIAMDESYKDMEEDLLKTRAGDENREEEKEAEEKEDTESDGHKDNDSDGNSDDDSVAEVDERELSKEAAFYDQTDSRDSDEIEMFSQLALSRPLLRGVAAMGFVKPTPIQSAVIPLALSGKDICASAVTGSGKTGAFLLPVLERMLHRHLGCIKAVVLTPTRELAAQCIGMLTTFSQFTDLRATLIVGGAKNVNAQAAELRSRPDIVIATPGRLLDHVTNSPGVTLEDVEFLILDEADRLLDLGFQDEVHELVKACPIQRQTMLFSATLNTKVDDLIGLSLKRPTRVRISDKKEGKDLEVAPRLEQEFIRIRAGNEGINREGMLVALLSRTFTSQTIVFFDTKKAAHRMMIICGLCGIKSAELHGNLTQQQRLDALEQFRTEEVDVLLATDLAARGLDIDRVATVVNFEMPSQVATYIHRIGRTARAGRGGRSCTLIGEGRRHLMKEIIKDADSKTKRNGKTAKRGPQSGVIRSRSIPAAVVAHFVAKIDSLEPHIEEIAQAEIVAKMDRVVEMEAIRAQNIIEHAADIKNRPQREWFATSKQKKMTKEASAEKKRMIEEKVGTGTHRMSRKKRRKREAEEYFNSIDREVEDGGEEERPSAVPNMKANARKKKREQEDQEKEAYGKSIHDLDVERAERQLRKKKRGVKATDAMGDSSLFAEERVSYQSKPTQKKKEDIKAKSTYEFKEFDPNRKLGKKKTHHKFKSKSKHKRR